MLKLKNVSKFYYSNGVIASGFSRVNLDLAMGEFVAITGESGSGKSTLLNVLSGLDTYEEGEMYIDGQETSHYNERDFEEYRRKYVGNIFQNFNLVNSYTVYQNVELALILNGESRKEAKARVLEIIQKVGLSDFAKTKCAKLSGGQKQRVAIARALAKETPIIVADEPTGNLDSQSAKEIVKLLSEISKDKLVIVVTHNLEQIQEYATRLIKMHDGKILEDKTLKKPEKIEEAHPRGFADITASNRIRLGARNAFNIPTKFILIFAVFLFVSLAFASTYSSWEKTKYEESLYGYNNYFYDTSDERVVINKEDRSVITEEDFQNLSAIENVKKIVKEDTLVDYTSEISDVDYNYYFYGNFEDIASFDGEVTIGRMPEASNEILLQGSEGDYYIANADESIFSYDYYMDEYDMQGNRITTTPMKVVGICRIEGNSDSIFYAGEEVLSKVQQRMMVENSNIVTEFEGSRYSCYTSDPNFYITPNDNVPSGQAYVSSSLNDLTQNGRAVGRTLKISVDSPYNKDQISLSISRTYNKSTLKTLTGVDYSDAVNGVVYINTEDYSNLINKGTFQSSVYVKDVKLLDETLEEIKALGFNTLAMRDSLNNEGAAAIQMITLMKTFMLAVLIVALFFISYFIIRIILKSRNAYYTTLRTLGASRKVAKTLLDIELFIIATLAYGVFMAVVGLVKGGVITQAFILDLAGYLAVPQYIIMYVIIAIMSYMISYRFSKKLFKESVMNTYREEA